MVKSSKLVKEVCGLFIVLMIMLIAAGCGMIKKNNTNIANSSNDPLYGQTITFITTGDDHHLALSDDSKVRIAAKATIFTMKKQEPKAKITKFAENHPEEYIKIWENDDFDSKVGKKVDKFMQEETGNNYSYSMFGYYEKMLDMDYVISNTYAKEGKIVTIRFPYNEYDARKGTVFEKAFKYTPRKVKVQMAPNNE